MGSALQLARVKYFRGYTAISFLLPPSFPHMDRLLLDATYSRKPVLGLEHKPPRISASGSMKNMLYFWVGGGFVIML